MNIETTLKQILERLDRIDGIDGMEEILPAIQRLEKQVAKLTAIMLPAEEVEGVADIKKGMEVPDSAMSKVPAGKAKHSVGAPYFKRIFAKDYEIKEDGDVF